MHSEIKVCHSKEEGARFKKLQPFLKSKFNPEILDVSGYITPKLSPCGLALSGFRTRPWVHIRTSILVKAKQA